MLDPEVTIKRKPASIHPLQSIVKDVNATKIKYAHNSVNNPEYPKLKQKIPSSNRIKFTIIGNMLSREFIYCVHIAKGMHKYRWKQFDAPEIRGYTRIEWPKVWNDLKIKYGGLLFCIESPVAILQNGKALGGEPEFRKLIEGKYVYHLTLDYYQLSVENFAKYVNRSCRPCAYMHIAFNEVNIGTLIFMLYADLVPLTSENFLRLCQSRKGGYSGTPIHRVVKDCWVQGGGFGLKDTQLDCENFCVPHDRRGVLCMANDGRHTDCSTQFFILLQPAPWMANKYVAFGQLIDGHDALKHIERVPTWYESPKLNIKITQAGILNMECQDIPINKCANEYMQKHIEDLVALGDYLVELLFEKLWLDLEFKSVVKAEPETQGEHVDDEENVEMKSTQRFLKKKEDLESEAAQLEPSTSTPPDGDNNDFDVEEYTYEPEEYHYQHISMGPAPSLIVKPMRPYYLAYTDVLYPGEVDSVYDLKKFLTGDYCLESDVNRNRPKKCLQKEMSYDSESVPIEYSPVQSLESLNSDDDHEIREYLKQNVDRVSFAGGIIKNIAKGVAKMNFFEDERRSSEMMHRMSYDDSKKVSISIECDREVHKIKRRQTGFVRPDDLERVRIVRSLDTHYVDYDDDDDDDDGDDQSSFGVRRVQISTSGDTDVYHPVLRRPTGAVRRSQIPESDDDVRRESILTRIHGGSPDGGYGPTLKDYKPITEVHQKGMLLTPATKMKGDTIKYYQRPSIVQNQSYENMLNVQHGKQIIRKISSDYVNTIDQVEHKVENSLRRVEYERTRPSLTVSEYQQLIVKKNIVTINEKVDYKSAKR